jgi:ribonuclease P protein component
MTQKQTLGKTERLKSQKAIEGLFSKGKSITISPLRILYQPAEKGLQFGVGVSAKNFKRAVDRNRIKRQVREACRLQKAALQDSLQLQHKGLHLFFTYISKEPVDYKIISGAVQRSLDKLLKMINETGTSNT